MLCTVLAPILAMIVVIGIKIKKAGIFIKPMLSGRLEFKKLPERRNPIAPNRAIRKPMAAALPIALFIE